MPAAKQCRARRILLVHSGVDLYGASRSLLRLASRLVQDRHEVLVVLPAEGPLARELAKRNVTMVVCRNLPIVTRLGMRTLRGIFQLVIGFVASCFVLSGLVRSFRPELIHTNTALIISPGLVAKLFRIPHIWHVREFFADFSSFWKLYQWYMYFLSSVILCVSGPVAGQFHERIQRRKVRVIHNGIPKEEFSPVGSDRIEAFRLSFGLNGHPVVGVVGRIKFGRKGQDVFLRAANTLKDRFPDARFLIIGSPFPGNEQHLENLMMLARELGLKEHLVLTGDVSDIQAAYAAMDVSVLPSAMPEPFGGVVIESMAAGKPVVGTRAGGTIEQIEDGATGFLVEPNDSAALASAIERLLRDPDLRQQLGKRARERFLSCFEFDVLYDRIDALYSEVTGLPGGTR